MAVNYEKMWRKPQRANRLFKLLVNNNNKQVAAKGQREARKLPRMCGYRFKIKVHEDQSVIVFG